VKQSKSVVIMGAGLAGLSAAYELSKSGYDVTVLEKYEEVGGLARTIKVGDFKFDTGPHRWYTKNSQVDNWLLAMLKDEVVRVPRLTRIYFDKKYFYYPLKLKHTLLSIGPGRAFRAIFDYLKARIRARIFPKKLVNMEDGYVNQFGQTLYEIFFKRYSEKLWGRDCREISVDWVGQRTRGLNVATLVKDALFKSKGVVSLVDEFSYPERGIGRIADKLMDYVVKKGGKVLLSSEVTQISTADDKVTSITVTTKTGKKEIKADYFISSIPINQLLLSLSPKSPIDIQRAAKKLQYRDEVQVTLFINKSKITTDTWIYVHPKELPFMRFMEMDNWSDKLSPKGQTAIVFEVACNEGDVIWKKKDQELIDMVADAYIKEFQLVTKKDIISGHVHKVPKEYPVYHIGYLEDVDRIKNYLKRYYNLQLIGRNGTFRYNNMDHSVEMGLYAAWNIIAGKNKHDIDSVNIEREYLEEKKIENVEDETVETN